MSLIKWSTDERQSLKINIFDQDVDKDNIAHKELPTDIHLVEYSINNRLYCDSVRAYKKADIFDAYYDKLYSYSLSEGAVFEIHSITSGYGSIKPKLWQGKKD